VEKWTCASQKASLSFSCRCVSTYVFLESSRNSTCQSQQLVSYENGRIVLMFIKGILAPIPQELLHDEIRSIRRRNRTFISRIPWKNRIPTVGRGEIEDLLFSGRNRKEGAFGEREADNRRAALAGRKGHRTRHYNYLLFPSRLPSLQTSPAKKLFCLQQQQHILNLTFGYPQLHDDNTPFSRPPCLNERSSPNTTPPTSTPPRSSVPAVPSKQVPKSKLSVSWRPSP